MLFYNLLYFSRIWSKSLVDAQREFAINLISLFFNISPMRLV